MGGKLVVVEERTGLTCRPAPCALQADVDDVDDDDADDADGREGRTGPNPIEETAAEGEGVGPAGRTWPAYEYRDDVG